MKRHGFALVAPVAVPMLVSGGAAARHHHGGGRHQGGGTSTAHHQQPVKFDYYPKIRDSNFEQPTSSSIRAFFAPAALGSTRRS